MSEVTVIEPRFVPGLQDERASFQDAVRRPIGTAPLRDVVKPGERLAVVIPDLTRPLPSDRLLPWLFEELAHVPAVRGGERLGRHPSILRARRGRVQGSLDRPQTLWEHVFAMSWQKELLDYREALSRILLYQ